jgi:AcrR family transcriptional regulator
MDKRIEKTYIRLQQSMRELLGKTTWDNITVRTLCENAGISRTTFYSNFKDKDDLLDTLLASFEEAMQTDNNGRSIASTGTFKFLPILVIHVSGNRRLFSVTNTTKEGYPVADRFRRLIERLTRFELEMVYGQGNVERATIAIIAGGIYSVLVDWSGSSRDATHLKLLKEIDLHVETLLRASRS